MKRRVLLLITETGKNECGFSLRFHPPASPEEKSMRAHFAVVIMNALNKELGGPAAPEGERNDEGSGSPRGQAQA